MENIHLNSRLSYSVGEIAALRDLFNGLARGVRACRQYPPQHPIPLQFKRTFLDQLKAWFEISNYLAVRVGFDSLETADDPVFHGAPGNDNIAHLLHRDGIRFLEITPAITESEVDAFFDAFVACSSADSEAVDIVNLFWQAGFSHIRYEVVDTFEPGEIAEITLELEEHTGLPQERNQAVIESAQLQNWTTSGSSALDQAAETRRYMTETYTGIDQFAPHELKSLMAMIQEDRAKDLKTEVVQLLLQLTAESGSVQDLRLTTEALQVAFDRLIGEGKFDILISIVKHVRELVGSTAVDSLAAKKRLTEFENRCGDSVRLKLITNSLNSNQEIDLRLTEQYLDLLGWESLNSLVWMLGELAHYPARRMLCDLLIRKGAEKLDILGSAVFDSRWFVVRNVAWVLGEMRNDRACTYLGKAAKHADERVRTEVIKAAAKLAGDSCAKVLLPMIEDSTERVRSLALEALGRTRSQVAYQRLSAFVKAKDFADVDPASMKELLEAFVLCGGADALEFALEVIGRSSLFNKARLLRLQEALVAALQFSDSPAALAALDKLTADARPAIAAAARKSLKYLRRHTGIDHE